MLARAFSCTTRPCLPRLFCVCPLIALSRWLGQASLPAAGLTHCLLSFSRAGPECFPSAAVCSASSLFARLFLSHRPSKTFHGRSCGGKGQSSPGQPQSPGCTAAAAAAAARSFSTTRSAPRKASLSFSFLFFFRATGGNVSHGRQYPRASFGGTDPIRALQTTSGALLKVWCLKSPTAGLGVQRHSVSRQHSLADSAECTGTSSRGKKYFH